MKLTGVYPIWPPDVTKKRRARVIQLTMKGQQMSDLTESENAA